MNLLDFLRRTDGGHTALLPYLDFILPYLLPYLNRVREVPLAIPGYPGNSVSGIASCLYQKRVKKAVRL